MWLILSIAIGFELTGYDDMICQLNGIVQNILLAAFSCVLFSGSCVLCTTDIRPETVGGVPVAALVGFILSAALGVYTILELVRGKDR